jgi:transcriptional regulator with XRE-family HTH domain
MFNRHKLPADELRELYTNQGLTMTEIAEQFNVSETTVRRRLNELGIISRSRGPKVSRDLSHLELTEDALRELYLERKLSIPQIAELCGWGRETIRQRLIENGIPIRSFSQAHLVQHGTWDEYKDFSGDQKRRADMERVRENVEWRNSKEFRDEATKKRVAATRATNEAKKKNRN